MTSAIPDYDHRAKAVELLEKAGAADVPPTMVVRYLAAAEVHATLAASVSTTVLQDLVASQQATIVDLRALVAAVTQ